MVALVPDKAGCVFIANNKLIRLKQPSFHPVKVLPSNIVFTSDWIEIKKSRSFLRNFILTQTGLKFNLADTTFKKFF